MNPKTHREQQKESVQADHTIITEAIDNFKKFFTGDLPPDADKKLADIRRIMEERLAQHFASEENELFPLLLADNPDNTMGEIISELCQEHKSLLEEARLLTELILHCNPHNLSTEFWLVTMRFLTQLEKHAAEEEALFKMFPE